MITLSVYTGVAFCTGRSPLSEAQSFMSLSIIILASTPLSNLVYSAPRFTGALECFQRIQEYLSVEPRQDYRETHCVLNDTPETSRIHGGPEALELQNMAIQQGRKSNHGSPKLAADIVAFHQANFSWSSGTLVLSDISIKFARGSFTVITGPVGSGKTMLLKAILGELHCRKGYVQIQPSLTVSFCDAVPWIRNKSIRETIIGPLDYDEEWYCTVIRACLLEEDIKLLPLGHSTIVGSNGISLSGGQRQRLAIARAVYSRPQLALFDEVLSALDAWTYHMVFENIFGLQGLLRRNGATSILVAHLQDLSYADQVVVLDEGRVSAYGNPSEVVGIKKPLSDGDIPSRNDKTAISGLRVHDQPVALPLSRGIEDVVDRKRGDLTNYVYYLEAAGARNMLLYIFCLFVGAFCSQFPSKWIVHCTYILIST